MALESEQTIIEGRLGNALDEYLKGAAASGFSGTVLVARKGQVILHKGYGIADKQTGRRITSGTGFDTGSVCKMFTAAAILKLESEGKLAVSDPITEYFENVPEDKAGITLHHLLTHTSGIELYSGEDYELISRDEMVRRVLNMALQWPPGSKYRYSNPAYALLGAIVEIVSGQPYEAYLDEHFFQPAGMSKTGYVLPGWHKEEVAGAADEDGTWINPIEQEWLPDGPGWNLRANGGMIMPASDLYRWHIAMQLGLLLSESARARMFTPYLPSPSTLPKNSSTGYGVYLSLTPRGTNLVSRAGTSIFGHSDYRFFLGEDIVLILTTNTEHGTVQQVKVDLTSLLFDPGTGVD